MSTATDELDSKLRELGRTFLRAFANGEAFIVFTVENWDHLTESLVGYVDRHFEPKEAE